MIEAQILAIIPGGNPALDDALLTLNNGHAAELSLLSAQRWTELVTRAFMAVHVGPDALLLAFDQDADYDSPNFLWFRERMARFVYIDRVVVRPAMRGRGYARQLYQHLFAQAAVAGCTRVVCEVNEEPPNPASDAFHQALGFDVIGSATIHGGTKQVRYFARDLLS